LKNMIDNFSLGRILGRNMYTRNSQYKAIDKSSQKDRHVNYLSHEFGINISAIFSLQKKSPDSSGDCF
jgi:hypothetical protein